MRVFAFLAMLGIIAVPTFAFADSSTSAPADEYFGRYQYSVLDIVNRLKSLEGHGSAVADPNMLTGIDDLESAIVDWQRKYPQDPWVARSLRRLLVIYRRANAMDDPHAQVALSTYQAYDDGSDPFDDGSSQQAYATPAPTYTNPFDEPQDQSQTAYEPAPAYQAPEPSYAQQQYYAPPQPQMGGVVIDANTDKPVANALVFVAPDRVALDPASTPFATTAGDGTFAVRGIAPAPGEYVAIVPPFGSGYAPYRAPLDQNTIAGRGVIRLAYGR
jgi:hypothetical protein